MGAGGADAVSSNQMMGYNAWSLDGTPGWDPQHKEAGAAQQGWDRAQSDYDARQANDAQMMTFMDQMMTANTPQEMYDPWRGTGGATAGAGSLASSFDLVNTNLRGLEEGQSYLFKGSPGVPGGPHGPSGAPPSWQKGSLGESTWNEGIPTADGTTTRGQWTYEGDYGDAWSSGDWSGVKGYDSSGRTIADASNDRNKAISEYATALGSATDFVNENVNAERSNAALMGVEYNITQEVKDDRVGNALKDFGWDAAKQEGLQGLLGKWGQGDFEQKIFIGEGTEAGSTDSTGQPIGTGGGTKPGTYLTEEEDTLGVSSLLGA